MLGHGVVLQQRAVDGGGRGGGGRRGAGHVGRHGRALVELPHVLLQVEVPAEAFAAHVAGEGLLVVVRVHVERQVVDLVEGLVADAAFVLLLRAVGQLVVLVVTLLVEALAAVLAHPRLVALVNPHVRVERGGPVEAFSARAALVRLVVGVDDFVSTQGAGLAKTLAADLADKGASPGVDGHVASQIVVGVENLAALSAREALPGFAADAAAAAGVAVCLHAVTVRHKLHRRAVAVQLISAAETKPVAVVPSPAVGAHVLFSTVARAAHLVIFLAVVVASVSYFRMIIFFFLFDDVDNVRLFVIVVEDPVV